MKNLIPGGFSLRDNASVFHPLFFSEVNRIPYFMAYSHPCLEDIRISPYSIAYNVTRYSLPEELILS